MNQQISTLRLLLVLTYTAMYFAFSLAVLRFIAPALISGKSDILVIIGLALIAIWLIWSITLAYYLLTKRRAPAATTQEEDQ
ncbi:hypothetical protein [Pseudomonas putida]|uniref:Uncharacterized protein n=1 Tax=Pseudomonas putida TaxID=303 RepID=A0A1B2F139_PSEPU|nr:hypothetical protein [Pseudomonas putida]ANY85955.1 hypothetical protein IEC33019_0351 [Pseudomonas putida]